MTTQEIKDDRLTTFLELISELHGTFSHQDFYHALEAILDHVLGTTQFTLVGLEKDDCLVLHSTILPGLRDRLRPPQVDERALLDLAAEAPLHPTGAALEGCNIAIEDSSFPVVNVWRLGAGGATTAFILFHNIGVDGDAEQTARLIQELHRGASVAFFRLADRGDLQEKLDLYQAKLQAINEVGELIGSLDVDVLLTKLMELSLYIASGEIGSVILVSKDGVENQVEWGFPLEMARSFVNRDGTVLYEQVIENKEPILARDFGPDGDYRAVGFDLHVNAYLCIPLISKGKCLGVINLLNANDHENGGFSTLDLDILMTISGLAATTIENALLYEDSLEKERYQQSLAIARDIQGRMYPSEAPRIDGFDVASKSQPCDETGGDYFDFVTQEDGSFTVAIGDVSGHGIGAALIMASARAGLRAFISQGEPLADAFSRLNNHLEMDMEIERFMTLFVATVDATNRTVTFVNAGHDAPCLYRARTGEVEELESTGVPLGLFPASLYTVGHSNALEAGDVLLLTTDGVWEVKSEEGEMLGKRRLIELFRRHAALPAAKITEALLADVAAFTGSQPPHDDATMVVVRCV